MPSVFYDTKCSFCSGLMNHIRLKAQVKGIKIIDIEYFTDERYNYLLQNDHARAESLIFIESGITSIYSDAVVRILIHLGGPYKFLGYLLKTIPRSIRNKIYQYIARNRYRIFGREDCRISVKNVSTKS